MRMLSVRVCLCLSVSASLSYWTCLCVHAVGFYVLLFLFLLQAEFTSQECVVADVCYQFAKNDKTTCVSNANCDFNEMDGNGGECQDKEAKFITECQDQQTNEACGKVTDCFWKMKDVKKCYQFRLCLFMTEGDCNGAKNETCYWDYGQCLEGVRPTTKLTTTSITTTTTVTTQTTGTTEYSCIKIGEIMCDSRDQCYPMGYHCDGGTPDCADKSDETNCTEAVTTTKEPVILQTLAPEETTEKSKTEQCVDTSACLDKRMAFDANNDDPNKDTTIGCRMCMTGLDETTLCSLSMTDGCASSSIAITTAPKTDPTLSAATTEPASEQKHPCVDQSKCGDNDEVADATSRIPAYASVECRICVTKKTQDELCEVSNTKGCPPKEDVVPKASAEERATADLFKDFRAKLPVGVAMDDATLHTALVRGLRALPSVRAAQLLDADFEKVQGSEFYRVVVFCSRFSGMPTDLAKVEGVEVAYAGSTVALFNSKVFNVDVLDKGGNPSRGGPVTSTVKTTSMDKQAQIAKDTFIANQKVQEALSKLKTGCSATASKDDCDQATSDVKAANEIKITAATAQAKENKQNLEAALTLAKTRGDVMSLELELEELKKTLVAMSIKNEEAEQEHASAEKLFNQCVADSGASACVAEKTELGLSDDFKKSIATQKAALEASEQAASKVLNAQTTTLPPASGDADDDGNGVLIGIIVAVILVVVVLIVILGYATAQGKFQLLPLRPRTTPFPEEKYILGVIYGVLLWADMNTATPLGAWGRSVFSLAAVLPPSCRLLCMPLIHVHHAYTCQCASMLFYFLLSLCLSGRTGHFADLTDTLFLFSCFFLLCVFFFQHL